MKHVFFSGIGGAGIGPLAIVAKQAGFKVSGSDKQDSAYIKHLERQGIESISLEQTTESIEKIHSVEPIDWLVYSSAVSIENPEHPELMFAKNHGIKATKRDDFLNEVLNESGQKMIAIAGTHGKTTTTAMIIWLFKKLDIPISYSVGSKLAFGEMANFNHRAEYFVYEADEYDRNFLSFTPHLSIISGIGYDHPDIYPTNEEYNQAFRDFIDKSNWTIAHDEDLAKLSLKHNDKVVYPDESKIGRLELTGKVNRDDGELAVHAVAELVKRDYEELVEAINSFPGLSRRFEKIAENIYSDYAHTPEKVLGALQMAHEVAGDNVVVVYEGLHNTRQHFIKDDLKTLFKGVKKLYIAPSYLAREDKSLEMLTPEKLCKIAKEPAERLPVELNDKLKESISQHAQNNDLVLCLTAGGGGSLDEWLRKQDFRG